MLLIDRQSGICCILQILLISVLIIRRRLRHFLVDKVLIVLPVAGTPLLQHLPEVLGPSRTCCITLVHITLQGQPASPQRYASPYMQLRLNEAITALLWHTGLVGVPDRYTSKPHGIAAANADAGEARRLCVPLMLARA